MMFHHPHPEHTPHNEHLQLVQDKHWTRRHSSKKSLTIRSCITNIYLSFTTACAHGDPLSIICISLHLKQQAFHLSLPMGHFIFLGDVKWLECCSLIVARHKDIQALYCLCPSLAAYCLLPMYSIIRLEQSLNT